MDQGEQHILMGQSNSEVSEVYTWMKTHIIINAIYNLREYSDVLIMYQ